MFDIAIIGGGPAGYVAAERAGAKGLKTVLFEKNKLGGVCLNEGCIPTKTLLYSAKIYDNARHGDKYGLTIPEAGFDYAKIVGRKDRVVRRLVGGVGAKMKAHGVTVVQGEATIKGGSEGNFEIGCGGESYRAAKILICTGSTATIPPIEGMADAGEVLLTNREILDMKERPQSLVIIGGGVIGMEFASFFNSLGTTVTVIEMMPEILPGLDPEISAMLRDVYDKRGVVFNMSCKVVKVEPDGTVHYLRPDGSGETVHGERILVSVGRRPVTQGLGLESVGVETERNAIKVDDRMRTNIPGVFAAGDVKGFSMLAHTASREGEVVVNNLTGTDDVMSYRAIPSVVYTNPEVACVGMSLEGALKEGLDAVEVKLPMAYAGRFVAENEGANGLFKAVVDKGSETVLGVSMLGNPSSEILYGACMAIERRMTLAELRRVVFPHPTVSEIFREALFEV